MERPCTALPVRFALCTQRAPYREGRVKLTEKSQFDTEKSQFETEKSQFDRGVNEAPVPPSITGSGAGERAFGGAVTEPILVQAIKPSL